MAFKDAQHPFFRPLWRRIAVVAACLVWAGVEAVAGDPTWMMITLAIGAYGAWTFLLRYEPPAETAPSTDTSDAGPPRS